MLNRLIYNNFLLLILLSSIWGSAFIAIKIAVQSISPISVACIRLSIAALILLTYFIYKKYSFNFSLKTFIAIFAIALTGNLIPFFLISWSELYIDSNLAGLLLSVAPIIALFLSHFLTTDDKFNTLKLLGCGLGFIGVIFLIGIDNLGLFLNNMDTKILIPQIAVLVAAFGYVLSSIIAYNLKSINTTTLTTGVLICASIMSLPFMFFYEYNHFSTPSFKSIIAVVYLGVMPTAAAYFLRFYIISRAGPVFLSYVAYLIPIFAIFWGVVFLKEIIPLYSIYAMFFIFLGIFIGQKGSNVQKKL